MEAIRDSRRPGDVRSIARAFTRRVDAAGQSPRLSQSVLALAGALHDIVAELRPSPDEFALALDFLTEVGHHTDDQRNEWVLLADVLGLSALVEDLDVNSQRPPGATPNTIAGPFYRADMPELALGSDISRDGRGERLAVNGRVVSTDGQGIAGAVVEVWQANADGLYENQDIDRQPEFNLRAKFRPDSQGRFQFLSVKPRGYSLPADGPVGRMLTRMGVGLERPAHIHFRVSAPGFQTLTTHIFDRADPAIERDSIFGVKPELLAEFRPAPGENGARTYDLDVSLVLCPRGRGV